MNTARQHGRAVVVVGFLAVAAVVAAAAAVAAAVGVSSIFASTRFAPAYDSVQRFPLPDSAPDGARHIYSTIDII